MEFKETGVVKNNNPTEVVNDITYCNNNAIEDRLSALPNSLLLEILTLLPLEDAAATSTLSHRWRHLWTHLTHLHIFSSPPPSNDYSPDKNLHEFATTVSNILHQHSSPHIHTFHLHYHGSHLGPNRSQLCSDSFNSWVPSIYAKNPIDFLIIFNSVGHDNHDDRTIITLPNCVLECESLLRLHLRGYFFCKLPQSGVIRLPNLKKLLMWWLHLDHDVLKILFKSCPLLEDLSVVLKVNEDEVIEIIGQNLKRIHVSMEGLSRNTKFVINAPLLEEFKVGGTVANYNFLTIPSMLHEASIAFWAFTFPLDSVLDLVRGITNVNQLQVVDSLAIFRPQNHMNVDDPWSVFEKLTHLTLILQQDFGLVDWNSPIPVCLLSRLKKVRLYSTKGLDFGIKLVKCILRNANVLEKFHVYCFTRDDNYDEEEQQRRLWEEFKFCGTLFRLSRRTLLPCEITFDGHYIKASGDEFRNGIFVSQIHGFRHREMWPNIEDDDE